MLSEQIYLIFYASLITIYEIVRKNIEKNINKNNKNIFIVIHNYFFFFLQILLTSFAFKKIVIQYYFVEMIIGIINILFALTVMYGFFSANLMEIHQKKNIELYDKIILLLLFPVVLINIIRNYYDTYTIGLVIFNINNIPILLWQLVIISLLNIFFNSRKYYLERVKLNN